MRAVRAGATERDLANAIIERYAEAGGDGLTMLVVGSGARSAHPNAPATDRVLQAGDVVRVDIIGTMRHYHSDVARTAVVGEPTAEQERIYALLSDVHERALAALRPGVVTSDVYKIYRHAMDAAGLPPYHFVGHGLGITLHEEPFVNELGSRTARGRNGSLRRAPNHAPRAVRYADRRRGLDYRGGVRTHYARRRTAHRSRREVKLTGFEVFLVALPSRREHTWASKTERPIGNHALLRLDTDEGVSGWGEAPAIATWGGAAMRYYGETPETVREIIDELPAGPRYPAWTRARSA